MDDLAASQQLMSEHADQKDRKALDARVSEFAAASPALVARPKRKPKPATESKDTQKEAVQAPSARQLRSFALAGPRSCVQKESTGQNSQDQALVDDIVNQVKGVVVPDCQRTAAWKKQSKNRKRNMVVPKMESRASNIKTEKQSKTIWAIEEALNAKRHVNALNPETPTKGAFTSDEEEYIRRAICAYRDLKKLDTSALADLIQWTDEGMDRTSQRTTSDLSPQDGEDARESAEFWDEMKRSLIDNGKLKRKFRTVKGHIRSRYHRFKRGGWTKEEDNRLVELYEKYPRQWKLIAVDLNRPSLHVHCRWAEHLSNCGTRKTGQWRKEEEAQLVTAVNTLAQRDEDSRFASGDLPRDGYSTEDISWQAVATEMGNTRSCVQIIAKWKQMLVREAPPTICVQFHPRHADTNPSPVMTPRVREPMQTGSVQTTPGSPSKRARHSKKRKSRRSSLAGQSSVPLRDWPGIDKIMWMDKFCLVEAIKHAQDQTEDVIDWDAIAEKSGLTWSKRPLQAALHELFALAERNGTVQTGMPFQRKVDAVVDLLVLELEHPEEGSECPAPFAVDQEFAVDHGGGMAASGCLSEEKGQRKRKKMGAHDNMAASQKKRRKTRASGATRPVFESKEMMVDGSAEAEAEFEAEQAL